MAFERDGREQVHVVELGTPTIQGSDVAFPYTPLEAVDAAAEGETADDLPADLGPVSLFIDDATAATSPEVTFTASSAAEFTQLANQIGQSGCVPADLVWMRRGHLAHLGCRLVDPRARPRPGRDRDLRSLGRELVR